MSLLLALLASPAGLDRLVLVLAATGVLTASWGLLLRRALAVPYAALDAWREEEAKPRRRGPLSDDPSSPLAGLLLPLAVLAVMVGVLHGTADPDWAGLALLSLALSLPASLGHLGRSVLLGPAVRTAGPAGDRSPDGVLAGLRERERAADLAGKDAVEMASLPEEELEALTRAPFRAGVRSLAFTGMLRKAVPWRVLAAVLPPAAFAAASSLAGVPFGQALFCWFAAAGAFLLLRAAVLWVGSLAWAFARPRADLPVGAVRVAASPRPPAPRTGGRPAATGPARLSGCERMAPAAAEAVASAWEDEHALCPLPADLVVGRPSLRLLRRGTGVDSPNRWTDAAMLDRMERWRRAFMVTLRLPEPEPTLSVWVPPNLTADRIRREAPELAGIDTRRHRWRVLWGALKLYSWEWAPLAVLLLPSLAAAASAADRDLLRRARQHGMGDRTPWLAIRDEQDDRELLRGCVFHECGHVRMMSSAGWTPAVSRASWRDPFGREICRLGLDRVSVYALTSPEEAFAEGYSIYRLGHADRLGPEAIAFIESVLDGTLPAVPGGGSGS